MITAQGYASVLNEWARLSSLVDGTRSSFSTFKGPRGDHHHAFSSPVITMGTALPFLNPADHLGDLRPSVSQCWASPL